MSAELIRRFGIPIRELSHLAALFRNIFAMRNEYNLRDPIEARILVAMLDDIRHDGRFSELPKLLKKYSIDKKEADRLLIKAKSFKKPNALFISWWAELEDARLFRREKFIWLYSTKPGHSTIVFFSPETLNSVSYSPVGLVVDLGRIMMGL